MTIQIKKAQRRRAKLRIGASGPSGSGKTYSALLIAQGLATAWDKVLLIDTENGSGELYSDLGAYNVITLTAPFTPEKYIEAIKAAEEAEMEVIIIDSTSHEWDGKGGCLEINERLAATKFKGNTWAAWSETTPRHQKFLEAITTSGCHVITTARSKTDTIQTEDKKIKKVGLKEIQREGFEYELTVNFNIDREGHYAIASKDRTGIFIERDPFVITKKTGEELLAWNNSGAEPLPPADPNLPKKQEIVTRLKMLGENVVTAESITEAVKRRTQLELVPANFNEIIGRLGITIEEIKEANGGVLPKFPSKPSTPAAPAPTTTVAPAEETMTQAEADALLGTFGEDDPNRPRTKENLDGSIDMLFPDGSKKRIKPAPGTEAPKVEAPATQPTLTEGAAQ